MVQGGPTLRKAMIQTIKPGCFESLFGNLQFEIGIQSLPKLVALPFQPRWLIDAKRKHTRLLHISKVRLCCAVEFASALCVCSGRR
jgi:hypothetical protein